MKPCQTARPGIRCAVVEAGCWDSGGRRRPVERGSNGEPWRVTRTLLRGWNWSTLPVTVGCVANRADHLGWADDNAGFAERLWASSDPVERRWSTVVAYYSILHTAHAVAADLWNEHPENHFEVRNVVLRMDPNRQGLAATIQEAYLISAGARYIAGDMRAVTWFSPYFTSEEDAIDRAMELMRAAGPELKRMAWG